MRVGCCVLLEVLTTVTAPGGYTEACPGQERLLGEQSECVFYFSYFYFLSVCCCKATNRDLGFEHILGVCIAWDCAQCKCVPAIAGTGAEFYFSNFVRGCWKYFSTWLKIMCVYTVCVHCICVYTMCVYTLCVVDVFAIC